MWFYAASAVLTADDQFYITSPNCDFVPEPLTDPVVVALRADYRFGLADPIQWPQVVSEKFEYLSVIRRRVSAPHPLAVLWEDPPQDDFEIIEGCEFKSLGLFKKSSLVSLLAQARQLEREIKLLRSGPPDHLRWLAAAMRQGCDRLSRFPCTRRDASLQYREVQRYCLMGTAFMEYSYLPKSDKQAALPLRQEFMGAFTSDSKIARKFYAAGIPVWYIRRKDKVRDMFVPPGRAVKPLGICGRAVKPLDICTDYGSFCGHALYSGPSGTKHIMACSTGYPLYFDISHAPLITTYSDANYSAPPTQNRAVRATGSSTTSSSSSGPPSEGPDAREIFVYGEQPPPPKVHDRKKRGRDVEELGEFQHDHLVQPVESWANELARIEANRPLLRSGEAWGFFYPPQTLLLGPETRAQRFLMSWVRILPAWKYLLQTTPGLSNALNTRWWHDLLSNFPKESEDSGTKNAKRVGLIRAQFSHLFRDEEYNERGGRVTWRDHHLSNVPEGLVKSLVWEFCESAFRQDLIAIDRAVFPQRHVPGYEVERQELISNIFVDRDAFTPADIPIRGVGLADERPARRAYHVEALRRLISRWPLRGCKPPSLEINRSTPELNVLTVERELIQIFIRTFFETTGRAPCIPHIPPQEGPALDHPSFRKLCRPPKNTSKGEKRPAGEEPGEPPREEAASKRPRLADCPSVDDHEAEERRLPQRKPGSRLSRLFPPNFSIHDIAMRPQPRVSRR